MSSYILTHFNTCIHIRVFCEVARRELHSPYSPSPKSANGMDMTLLHGCMHVHACMCMVCIPCSTVEMIIMLTLLEADG